MMRLDKYLCETGFGTRSQVKDLLKKGQVMVNGEVVKKPELKINETTDQILCQGKKVSYQKNIYLMLHKPAGVVSAGEDGAGSCETGRSEKWSVSGGKTGQRYGRLIAFDR